MMTNRTKIEFIGMYSTWREWSYGMFVHSCGRTLVVLIGTAWQFGLSHSDTAFGLCIGPFTVGGAK